jgi:hypothetical protein
MKDLETVASIAADATEVEEPGKNRTNYDLVDGEVAQWAAEARIDIDKDTSSRLKKMIDKRILVVMMVTYFIQSLDKGTMSFASIMGIVDDANLKDNQVRAMRIWF